MAKITTPCIKYGTASDWSKAKNFTPSLGTIIIYNADDDSAAPRVKYGDGKQNVNDLPFVGATMYSVQEDVLEIN